MLGLVDFQSRPARLASKIRQKAAKLRIMPSVLIVDDYQDSSDVVAEFLAGYEFECTCVLSGAAALERMRSEPFDLMLLDVSMPRMSGLELLRVIRRTYTLSALPVVMVTGHDATAEVVAALEAGANDYVTKPIDLPVLLARIRTQWALLQLARLKDEFLRIASHDLKNPLTAILGGAELLVEYFPAGSVMTADGANMVKSIHRRAADMRRLVKDFLDMQAIEDGQFTLALAEVDLLAVAAKVVDDQRAYAERKQIELPPVDAAGPVVVRADSARLEQVIQNFVGNALKFSRAGTRTVVRVSASAGAVRCEVEDQGPGLTADDMTKLFRKHARLSNRPTAGEHSSGHGLAICKRMIELHGGRIGANNNPERGSTFWFEIPAN